MTGSIGVRGMRALGVRRASAVVVPLLALALVAVGCDSPAAPPAAGPAVTPPPSGVGLQPSGPATGAGCPATADLTGLSERQGSGDGATLWALFFPTTPTLTTGEEIKIAWRMTGSGTLSMSATGPSGAVVRPAWGPEAHTGSNWGRPGDEWGTGWVFPAPGCWTIHAQRSSGSGDLVVRVALTG